MDDAVLLDTPEDAQEQQQEDAPTAGESSPTYYDDAALLERIDTLITQVQEVDTTLASLAESQEQGNSVPAQDTAYEVAITYDQWTDLKNSYDDAMACIGYILTFVIGLSLVACACFGYFLTRHFFAGWRR